MEKRKPFTDFAQFDQIPRSFKCDRCHRKWPPMQEKGHVLTCICGNRKPRNFWQKQFRFVKPELNLREASKIIGAEPSGSTLRRAILEKRLKAVGRVGKKEHLITREELIRFYLQVFSHRKLKKGKHGKPKANHKQAGLPNQTKSA